MIGKVTSVSFTEKGIKIETIYKEIKRNLWFDVPQQYLAMLETIQIGTDVDFTYDYNDETKKSKLVTFTPIVPDNATDKEFKSSNSSEPIVENKPTQAYWEAKQDLIIKEWAYGQAKDLVLGLLNSKDINDDILQDSIKKWASWFYREAKGI